MWKSWGCVALVAALGVAGLGWTAAAQQPAGGAAYSSPGGRGDLITYCLPVEGKPTALTVIDPQQRRIAVYHVNRESGEIQLKSVRNIAWDLSMEYFNSGDPLPEEIRRGLDRQQ